MIIVPAFIALPLPEIVAYSLLLVICPPSIFKVLLPTAIIAHCSWELRITLSLIVNATFSGEVVVDPCTLSPVLFASILPFVITTLPLVTLIAGPFVGAFKVCPFKSNVNDLPLFNSVVSANSLSTPRATRAFSGTSLKASAKDVFSSIITSGWGSGRKGCDCGYSC